MSQYALTIDFSNITLMIIYGIRNIFFNFKSKTSLDSRLLYEFEIILSIQKVYVLIYAWIWSFTDEFESFHHTRGSTVIIHRFIFFLFEVSIVDHNPLIYLDNSQ